MKKLIRVVFALSVLLVTGPALVLVLWADAPKKTMAETADLVYGEWKRIFWEKA